jgi:CheY-like chemotaxis protein
MRKARPSRDDPAHPSAAAPPLSQDIKQAKAVTEAARERLARANHAFANTRRRLQATEEIFQHIQARREYEAEHAAAQTLPMPPPAGLPILLIEESLADATLFRHALTECGLRCQLTVLGRWSEVQAFFTPALPGASFSLPRLIIADCLIPGMEAEDLLALVRAVPAYEQIPVVLFSTLPAEEGERRRVQCGATAFIDKPCELQAFVAAVSAMVCHWGGGDEGLDPVHASEKHDAWAPQVSGTPA